MLRKHARSMALLQRSSHQRLARPPRNVTFFIVWGFIQYRSGKLQIKVKRASSMTETDVIYDVVVVAAMFG